MSRAGELTLLQPRVHVAEMDLTGSALTAHAGLIRAITETDLPKVIVLVNDAAPAIDYSATSRHSLIEGGGTPL